MQRDRWPEHFTWAMLFMMGRTLKKANTLHKRKLRPDKLKSVRMHFNSLCDYVSKDRSME